MIQNSKIKVRIRNSDIEKIRPLDGKWHGQTLKTQTGLPVPWRLWYEP
jgi:hypothetical protein